TCARGSARGRKPGGCRPTASPRPAALADRFDGLRAMWHIRPMLSRRTLTLSAALLPVAARAQGGFEAFVEGVKAEARRMGIRDGTLQAAFAGVQPNQRVVELDRRQP